MNLAQGLIACAFVTLSTEHDVDLMIVKYIIKEFEIFPILTNKRA